MGKDQLNKFKKEAGFKSHTSPKKMHTRYLHAKKKIQEQHDEICILTEKNAKLESAKKQLQKQSFRQNKEIMSWKISDEKKKKKKKKTPQEKKKKKKKKKK